MGRECGTYGDRRHAYRVLVGNLKERDQLENLGVNGSMILKQTVKKLDEGMDLTDLAQDRDRWRTLVNVIMNLRVP